MGNEMEDSINNKKGIILKLAYKFMILDNLFNVIMFLTNA